MDHSSDKGAGESNCCQGAGEHCSCDDDLRTSIANLRIQYKSALAVNTRLQQEREQWMNRVEAALRGVISVEDVKTLVQKLDSERSR